MRLPVLFSLLAVAAAMTGCDQSEDPNLLNPPKADSTIARVVNLVDGKNVSLTLAGLSLATSVVPLGVTDYRKILFNERITLLITRGARMDTLRDQTVPKAAHLTFLVMSNSDTAASLLMMKQTSATDSADMTRRRVARLVFINAVPSGSYLLKSGCQSGDTLFGALQFGSSVSIDTNAAELSAFLFDAQNSATIASSRVQLSVGSVTYLIAARLGGVVKLYVLTGSDANIPGGLLPEAAAEIRTTAQVSMLNAVSDSLTISGSLQGSAQPIATGLGFLQISPDADIPVCVNPNGDSLSITTAGGGPALLTSIRLSVGRRALVVVYDNSGTPRSAVLSLGSNTQPTPGKAYVRALNLSPGLNSASIAVGAGAPAGVFEGYRPFGTLIFGGRSDYVEMPVGLYPLQLIDGTTGMFLSGGLQTLQAGFYTMYVLSRNGRSTLMLTQDDAAGTLRLVPLAQSGQRVLLFNMMPDTSADFSAGPVTVSGLAYSYVSSTVLPFGTTTITSKAGSAGIDLNTGGYVIGAVGSGAQRQLVTVSLPRDTVQAGSAWLRCLSVIPGAQTFSVHLGTVSSTPMIPSLSFADVSPTIRQDPRKYSFLITQPGDTAVQARIDGIELISGRRYLLIIGQNKTGSISQTLYATLLMQE